MKLLLKSIDIPYYEDKLSVWCATDSFFLFFELKESMKVPIPENSVWTFEKPKTNEEYWIIFRTPEWCSLRGMPSDSYAFVKSDDDTFIDELLAGTLFSIGVEEVSIYNGLTDWLQAPTEVELTI
jgi:hypothetical protein